MGLRKTGVGRKNKTVLQGRGHVVEEEREEKCL